VLRHNEGRTCSSIQLSATIYDCDLNLSLLLPYMYKEQSMRGEKTENKVGSLERTVGKDYD